MPLPGWASIRVVRKEEKWGVPPALDDTLDEALVNEWILCRLEKWEDDGIEDEDLWEEY